MERYYNSLKAELIDRFRFHTDEQLDYAVAEYVYLVQSDSSAFL
jgi:hypothetical protein